MPTAPLERIRSGLAGLEPESRALLELSVRRRVSDTDIAQLLHVDAEDVHRRLDVVIDALAGRLGLGTQETSDELRAALSGMPDELWLPASNGHGAVQVEVPAAAAQELEALDAAPASSVTAMDVATEPEPPTERPSPRVLTWAGAALLALVAGGAAIALASGGGDEGPSQAQQPAAPPPGRFQPLPGAKGAGAARIDGRALRLRVAELPPARSGFYEAWVYNSVGDARSIGRLRRGALNAPLPGDARRYRFVDVSHEPRDGNPEHGGASVVRVPLRGLLGLR